MKQAHEFISSNIHPSKQTNKQTENRDEDTDEESADDIDALKYTLQSIAVQIIWWK